ncbi:hypothetical protein BT69DRAFT_1216806 [Atractiella rhizophila]|nr:hypothetical protein BT69DRAFT_1216806 [Atractiella rhizophila]
MDVDPPPAAAPAPAPEATEAPTAPAVEPSHTIYVHNLNEKVKLKILSQSLRNLFSLYGRVLSVTCHSNLRMRGQAFVGLDNLEGAKKAVEELKGLPIYGKGLLLEFARTSSDAVVKRFDKENFDKHLEERKITKKIHRRNNPLRRKWLTQKQAALKAAETTIGPDGLPIQPAFITAQRRNILQMPDEYLPPNKILFIQNLPEVITKEKLDGLFKQYPSLVEVRMIPGRKGIAFVEYADEQSSTVAKEALHNYRFTDTGSDLKMKVTFAKQ